MGSIVGVQFGQYVLDVALHGFFCDGELGGDLFVGIAARNQLSAFENKVNALRGKMLTDAQADLLLSLAAKALQLL